MVGTDGTAVLRRSAASRLRIARRWCGGADFLAVVCSVWNHPDGPAAGVRAMNAAIRAATENG